MVFAFRSREAESVSPPAHAVAPAAAPAWGASAASITAASAASSAPVAAWADRAAAAASSRDAFVRAVEQRAKEPPAPPNPAIANAKTFPEAFEAMKAAQRQAGEGAPPGTAGINPFAASAPK